MTLISAVIRMLESVVETLRLVERGKERPVRQYWEVEPLCHKWEVNTEWEFGEPTETPYSRN